jgi:hypothetical protein
LDWPSGAWNRTLALGIGDMLANVLDPEVAAVRDILNGAHDTRLSASSCAGRHNLSMAATVRLRCGRAAVSVEPVVVVG